jgi:hypothetical protein
VKLLLLERQRPNFGNGGAVEALALNALRAAQSDKRRYLLEDDFGKLPPEVDAADGVLLAGSPLAAWFASKRDQVRRCQQRGVQPVLPTVYAFVGSGSGLGRKTEARELVRLLHGIHCCAGTAVREVSISAIVAKFVGQSTPKLLELLRESLGGMLLVTNAGRLLSTEFGCEVVRELFDAAARSEFAQKVVVGMTLRPEEFNAMCELEPAARTTQVFKYERPTAAVCADVAVMYMRKRQLFVAPDGSTLRSLRHALQLVRTSFDAVGCPNEFGGLRLATQLVELCDQKIDGRWGDEKSVWGVAADLCHPSFVVPPYTPEYVATPPASGLGAAPAAASGVPNSNNVANYMSSSNLIKAGRVGGGGQTASASDRANSVLTQAIVKTAVESAVKPPLRNDEAGVRDAAAPVVVELLARVLEAAVAARLIPEEAAANIAANHDFEEHEDATTGLPAELVSFMHRAGLEGDAMRKEAASMRARMREAKAKKLTVCPICFLPEQPARQIGCPWSFP